MPIARFHYLTQDLPGISHQELAETACRNGIRWVQLRVKNKPLPEILQIATETREITAAYAATLIVNDHVEIARQVDADGVHLGKTDMPVAEARKILGPDKIIGGTANTMEDILELQKAGVDYIGLGPFRFTSTKEKLSPVLGIENYSKFSTINYQLSIPIIAIGGIQPADIQPLLQTGVYGVAVSSAINLAPDRSKAIQECLVQFSFTSR